MFLYFGYGSNINLISLNAKGVEPISSQPGILRGWRLRFNVQHEEIRKTLTKILAAGLYTREQLDAMTHDQFCAVIVDYDFDYGERVVDKASIALDEFDLQHGC
jgi:hypothetical protein